MHARLILGSANPHKAQEMSEILAEVLGTGVEIALRPAEIPDVVEDGHTLEENARIKAVAISKATGSSVATL